MRKRLVWLVLAIVLLAALIFYTVFFQQTFKSETRVPFTMFKVAEQFSRPALVAKWYVPFSTTDVDSTVNRLQNGESSLEIINETLVTALLRAQKGNHTREFHLIAAPDSALPKETIISLAYRNTLFREWFQKDELVKNAQLSISNLKDYMEDPKRLYGYDIQVTNVADTAFLFTTATVPISEKRKTIRELFEKLIDYAAKRDAGYTGVRIMYSQVSNNEITLYTSIGVSNKIYISPDEPFQYKLMPFGKKLLEANYQGLFGDVDKVYQALETFKTDHNLITMAIPFQKFMNDGYDFGDSQLVQMKVYYPIF